MVGGVETAPCTMMYTCVEQYVVSGVHTALCISTVCTLCRVWSNMLLVEWRVWSNYSFTSQVHCVQCTVCGVDSELCTSTLCRVHSVEQYVVVRVDSVEQRAV